MGEGFDKHLVHMLLNKEPIDWSRNDISYLKQENYNPLLQKWVSEAELFNGTLAQLQQYCAVDLAEDTEHTGDLVIRYGGGPQGFTEAAKHLPPMMTDSREGFPRGSYQGTVTVRCRGRRLFITPG